MANANSSTTDLQDDPISNALTLIQRAGAITDLLYSAAAHRYYDEFSNSTISNSLDAILIAISDAEEAITNFIDHESKVGA